MAPAYLCFLSSLHIDYMDYLSSRICDAFKDYVTRSVILLIYWLVILDNMERDVV